MRLLNAIAHIISGGYFKHRGEAIFCIYERQACPYASVLASISALASRRTAWSRAAASLRHGLLNQVIQEYRQNGISVYLGGLPPVAALPVFSAAS